VNLVFVIGHECTVDSYWRCALPARALHGGLMTIGAAIDAPRPDIAWIHQPISMRAERLAQETKAAGGCVVLDFSEDPWARDDLFEDLAVYKPPMLAAARRLVNTAEVIVVTSRALGDALGRADAIVIEPRLPGRCYVDPQEPEPDAIAWWSDGRQKRGFAEAAPYLARALRSIDGRMWHIQFPHMAPLDIPGSRQTYVATASGKPALNARHFQLHMGRAYLAIESWPDCEYRETVSDLSILRNAAVGAPTITTRRHVPPGAISAPPHEWPRLIGELHEEPGKRRALSLAAREWAETRLDFEPYRDLLSTLGH
jgi:hypothetical protein